MKKIVSILLVGGLVTISLLYISSSTPKETKIEEYRTIVIFRDDDIQPGFRLETMKKVNSVFIEEEVPVTLGLIPCMENMSLSKFPEFCNYLKKLKEDHPDIFEFAQHGYNHKKLTSFHKGSEFGGLKIPAQKSRIKKGREAMQTNLEVSPQTFIPPYNTYDENTVSVLSELGFKVVSGGESFSHEYFGKRGIFMEENIVHTPCTQSFVKNWKNHAFYDLELLKNRFENAYKNGSIYTQMIHYFTFTDQKKLNQLKEFVQFIESHENVKFMTLGNFGKSYIHGKVRKTSKGWEVKTVR